MLGGNIYIWEVWKNKYRSAEMVAENMQLKRCEGVKRDSGSLEDRAGNMTKEQAIKALWLV